MTKPFAASPGLAEPNVRARVYGYTPTGLPRTLHNDLRPLPYFGGDRRCFLTSTFFGPGLGDFFGGVEGVDRLCDLTDTVFLAKNHLHSGSILTFANSLRLLLALYASLYRTRKLVDKDQEHVDKRKQIV